MADYMHFSLRLNRELPDHYKIIKFLDEMDPKKYKSKTKFLADALYFYIQCIENGLLEKLKNPHFWENSSEFVTRGEFDSRLEGLSDSIEKKIYKEIMSLYVTIPAQASMPEISKEEYKDFPVQNDGGTETTLEDNLGQYAGVMDSIMSWSSDNS